MRIKGFKNPKGQGQKATLYQFGIFKPSACQDERLNRQLQKVEQKGQ